MGEYCAVGGQCAPLNKIRALKREGKIVKASKEKESYRLVITRIQRITGLFLYVCLQLLLSALFKLLHG